MTDKPDEAQDQENLKEQATALPNSPGVYLMKDDKERVIYVGKAKDLKKRVKSYFNRTESLDPKTKIMVSQVQDIEYLQTDSEVDALVLESRMIKDIQPKYNISLKDDKSYPYLAITNREDFPRIYITRDQSAKKTTYYGPFTEVSGLRAAVNMLQLVFKFRNCTMSIKEEDEKLKFQRPCLLYHIKQCSAPCNGSINSEQYKKDIQRFKKFILGKRKNVIKELEAQMKHASAKLEFETAAGYRDQLKAISSLSKRSLLGEVQTSISFKTDYSKVQDELREALDLSFNPRSIEGVDIAHLQGEHTVASIVSFIDGQPFKAGYRKYKIKTVTGIDDYASIQEVVTRRYTRLEEEGLLFPDIFLIDGGKGQLNAVIKTFQDLNIEPPKLVAIAKKEEILYTEQHNKDGIKLAKNSIALQVLQQVRDEAHRFAQHYHKQLRHKKITKPK